MKRSLYIFIAIIGVTLILTSTCIASEDKQTEYERLMYSALQYEKEGNVRTAASQYLRAAKHDPTKAEPLAKVSILYLLLRNPQKAQAYAEAALKIEPKHLGALINLSAIHLAKGEWIETINVSVRGLSIEPDNAALLINKGAAFFYKELYDYAEKDLLKVLKKDPLNASANYNLACVYSKTNRSMAAVVALEKAFKSRPKLKSKAPLDMDLQEIWDDKYFLELMAK